MSIFDKHETKEKKNKKLKEMHHMYGSEKKNNRFVQH